MVERASIALRVCLFDRSSWWPSDAESGDCQIRRRNFFCEQTTAFNAVKRDVFGICPFCAIQFNVRPAQFLPNSFGETIC